MSFLNGTGTIKITSKLPAGATRAQGVAMLQDRDFFIRCDPHMETYERLEAAVASPQLPGHVKARGATSSYKVLDVIENVPKALWGSHIESTYELTDTETGVFSRVRSPLGVVLDCWWDIKEGEEGDGGGLVVVEEGEIRCSRLLVGIVKAQCEAGAGKIHAKMLERLASEVEAAASKKGSAAA